jgi:hypothetical protein
MKRLVLSFAVALVLVGNAGHAWASSPKAFDDDYDAALAASGDTQWLIVGGVDRRGPKLTYGIKAFERSGTGPWQELPPLPGKGFNSSYTLRAVVQGTADPAPCFLYPIDAGPRLECLRNGAWEDALGASGQGLRGANVEDLIAPTPDSMALVYLRVLKRHDRVLTYVTRSDAGGPWQQVGEPLEGVMIAQFERSDVLGTLRLGIERMNRHGAKRYVAAASGNQWVAATPVDHTPEGPFVGGPVSVAGTTYFPAIDGTVFPFEFNVLSLAPGGAQWAPVGGEPLSSPTGAGQGTVALLDGDPWAIWQEDTERGHSFNSTIRIANLAGPTPAPVDLWSGKRIGPGPANLVDAPGPAMYALYAQGTRKGLRVAVDDITP